jgi:hypothetical protein
MELSPFWEADICSPTQDLHKTLWNSKFHCRVHNSPPLFLILSQMNPAHNHQHISLRSILILFSYLLLGLPTGLSFSLSLTKIGFAFIFSLWELYATPNSLPLTDHSNYIWRRVQVLKLLIKQFSPVSSHFSPLLLKYSQQPVLSHPQSVLFP